MYRTRPHRRWGRSELLRCDANRPDRGGTAADCAGARKVKRAWVVCRTPGDCSHHTRHYTRHTTHYTTRKKLSTLHALQKRGTTDLCPVVGSWSSFRSMVSVHSSKWGPRHLSALQIKCARIISYAHTSTHLHTHARQRCEKQIATPCQVRQRTHRT